ncbi:MAG: argininosuccinate lyase [Candidatus Omnitrophota bacterium]
MAKKLWGGRFGKKTDPLVEEFTKSIQYDYKLAKADIAGSLFHIQVLKKCTYLSAGEFNKLHKALKDISHSLDKNTFKFDKNSEDIHTNIQSILAQKVGALALKLHTARSRNDQVAFATKVYCKLAISGTLGLAEELTEALGSLGAKNGQVIIPGFTHMQHAQPVYLKDYLGAYIEMLDRDQDRLEYISKNIKLTLGSGALAGTPVRAEMYEFKAGVEAPDNSLDSVSDRDFVIEIISALSILAMHLSRMAEDLIIWSTKEFDFIEIDEAFCTGSSLMPQKKNADVLELVRGYAGRLYGNLVSVLTMMKGLPLTYNRDMQLDKEPLFNSFEIVSSELKVLAGLIKTLKFNKAKIAEHLKDEGLYATDIVYYLVNKKIAFKEAHTIVGKLVKYSLDNGIEIKDMPEPLLKKFSVKFVKKEIVKLFDPIVSVKSKKSIKRG